MLFTKCVALAAMCPTFEVIFLLDSLLSISSSFVLLK